MKARKRNFKKTQEIQSYWPSFTDVMSTIALVLFFLMLLAYIQNIISGKKFMGEIAEKQRKVDALIFENEQKQQELLLMTQEIERTQAEVELGNKKLKLSQKEIEEQRKIIAESNEELGDLRTKLQQVAVLRLDILEKVKESIEKEIGKTNDRGEALVTIGDNANIIINESLVFDYNSYTIKQEGKELLAQFAVAFEKVLDDANIRDSIDAINIEGHTDDSGDSKYNRELSTKRATTVVNYMMLSNYSLENKYGEYFAATGYSEFRPISSGDSETAMRKNRRIEISIIIKDSNVQKIINDYLNQTDELLN